MRIRLSILAFLVGIFLAAELRAQGEQHVFIPIWFADDVGTAEHQSVEAAEVAEAVAQQHQGAQWGAGDHGGVGAAALAGGEAAGVDDVKTVDVFMGCNGVEIGRASWRERV